MHLSYHFVIVAIILFLYPYEVYKVVMFSKYFLFKNSEINFYLFIYSVLNHHVKFNELSHCYCFEHMTFPYVPGSKNMLYHLRSRVSHQWDELLLLTFLESLRRLIDQQSIWDQKLKPSDSILVKKLVNRKIWCIP